LFAVIPKCWNNYSCIAEIWEADSGWGRMENSSVDLYLLASQEGLLRGIIQYMVNSKVHAIFISI